MAFTIRGEIHGASDVVRRLNAINDALRTRILKKAMTKAGRIVVAAARQNVPVDTGQLKKSLGSVVRAYASGVIVVVIGPRKGFATMVVRTAGGNAVAGTKRAAKLQAKYGQGSMRKHDPALIAHLVEYGTQPHAVSKGARLPRIIKGRLVPGTHQNPPMHPGAVAKPFLRPAFDNTKAAVTAAVVAEINSGIDGVLSSRAG